MKTLLPIRILYYLAAAYDGLLGLLFIVAGPRVYELAGITPPNHWGYVHFAAGLLVLFGFMFLRIALRPVEERNLVLYGIFLKICYVATVAWYWINGGVPDMWKWFAGADVVFAFLFFWSMVILESAAAEEKSS
jgi:hypothetical protein